MRWTRGGVRQLAADEAPLADGEVVWSWRFSMKSTDTLSNGHNPRLEAFREFSVLANDFAHCAVTAANGGDSTPATASKDQEQIQKTTTAIDKPRPRAAAIVDANANSKSSSCCTLSSSGMAYSTNRKAKRRHRMKRQTAFWLAHICQKAPSHWCSKMVNEVLTVGQGPSAASRITDLASIIVPERPERAVSRAAAVHRSVL